MQFIVYRTLTFLVLIAFGFYLRIHISKSDNLYDGLTWIIMHVTLPCVIALTMNGRYFTADILLLIPLGILCNIILMMSCLMYRNGHDCQAAYMISISGFNIGCFALPLVHGMFGDEAMLALCMFDLGNAIMCLGMNADVVKRINKEQHISFRKLLGNTLHSVPVWTYIIMLILCQTQLILPEAAVSFLETAGNANPFLAMVTIGLAMNLHIHKADALCIIQCLGLRSALAILMGIAMLLLPIEQAIQQMLTLLCFSPISAVSPVFAKKLHLRYETSANINSIYMFVSMLLMCGYMLVII